MTFTAIGMPTTVVPPRLAAIDIARFLAIIGMMGAHLVIPLTEAWGAPPGPEANAAASVTWFVNGNASTLFAVLGGMSMVLASRASLASGKRAAAMASMAMRAALVILLGLLLSTLGAPVFVVLQYFGWSMALAMPLLLAPTWLLGTVAVTLVTAGPWLLSWVRTAQWLDHPLSALIDLTFTGQYPAITWVAYLAIGMLLARMFLSRSSRTRRVLGVALAIVGTAATVIALMVSNAVLDSMVPTWLTQQEFPEYAEFALLTGNGAPAGAEPWWQLTAIGHSGTVFDILRGVGVSGIIIGALVALLPDARVPRPLGAVRAAGAAPLTLYTVHVVALTIAVSIVLGTQGNGVAPIWLVQGFGTWGVHVAGAVLLGLVLAHLRQRAPLERGISAMARIAASWVR